MPEGFTSSAKLKYFLAIISLGYTIFAYIYQKDKIWLRFILMTINSIFQSTAILLDMDEKFPRIIYNTGEYKPSCSLKIVKFLLGIIFWCLPVFLMYISLLFTFSSEIALLQMILLTIDVYVVINFLRNGVSDCSGWAFSQYLQNHNNQDIPSSFLPSSIPDELMEKYMNEYYVSS